MCCSLAPGKFIAILLNHGPSGLGILNRRGGNGTAVMQLLETISCFSFNEESRETKYFIAMQT